MGLRVVSGLAAALLYCGFFATLLAFTKTLPFWKGFLFYACFVSTFLAIVTLAGYALGAN